MSRDELSAYIKAAEKRMDDEEMAELIRPSQPGDIHLPTRSMMADPEFRQWFEERNEVMAERVQGFVFALPALLIVAALIAVMQVTR